MHEFSIATALLELAQSHVPPGETLKGVHVLAGPMRRVDPDAMQAAWQQATVDLPCAGAALKLELSPWKLKCPRCQREWESEELYVACACGCPTPHPQGGDEMLLVSIDV